MGWICQPSREQQEPQRFVIQFLPASKQRITYLWVRARYLLQSSLDRAEERFMCIVLAPISQVMPNVIVIAPGLRRLRIANSKVLNNWQNSLDEPFRRFLSG